MRQQQQQQTQLQQQQQQMRDAEPKLPARPASASELAAARAAAYEDEMTRIQQRQRETSQCVCGQPCLSLLALLTAPLRVCVYAGPIIPRWPPRSLFSSHTRPIDSTVYARRHGMTDVLGLCVAGCMRRTVRQRWRRRRRCARRCGRASRSSRPSSRSTPLMGRRCSAAAPNARPHSPATESTRQNRSSAGQPWNSSWPVHGTHGKRTRRSQMRWVDERRFHFTSLRGREGKRRDSLPRAKRWEPGARGGAHGRCVVAGLGVGSGVAVDLNGDTAILLWRQHSAPVHSDGTPSRTHTRTASACCPSRAEARAGSASARHV